jgi:hypothetical protein
VKRSQLAVAVLALAAGGAPSVPPTARRGRYPITFVAVDADGDRDAATAIVGIARVSSL